MNSHYSCNLHPNGSKWTILKKSLVNFDYTSGRKKVFNLPLKLIFLKRKFSPTLSASDIVYAVGMTTAHTYQYFFHFDFKNGCKNELKHNNEKSCSWSRNRVSQKIDFKAQWKRNDSVRVNNQNIDAPCKLQSKNQLIQAFSYNAIRGLKIEKRSLFCEIKTTDMK